MNIAQKPKRYVGRHRRCSADIWCGGARCHLAVQHTGACVHWRPA